MVAVLLYILSFFFIYRFFEYKDRVCQDLDKTNYKEIILCFLLLFIFFGLRNINILNDTNHYYQHFYNVLSSFDGDISKIDFDDRFEFGYLYFENIIAYFFNDPYYIILISAAIISIANIWLIKNNTNNIALVIYMLLGTILLSQYSGLRQGLSLCFSNFAIYFLMKDRLKTSVSFVFLAWSFHSSAFIILVLFLLRRLSVNSKSIIWVVVFSVVAFLYLNVIMSVAGFEDSIYLRVSLERETFPLASLMNFLIGVMFLVMSYRSYARSKMLIEPIWWWISILNVVCLSLDIQIQIMARFSNFFYLYSIFLWWRIVCNLDERERNFQIRFVSLVIFIKIAICLYFRPEWYHLYPYSFFGFGGSFIDVDFGY